MMLGVQDRAGDPRKGGAEAEQAKPAEAKPAEQKPGEQKPAAQKPGAQKPDAQQADARRSRQNPDDDEQQPNIAAPEPQRGARTRRRPARIPHREMGRALRKEDRRDDRGAEVGQHSGAVGRPARDPRRSNRPPTRSISTNSIARASRSRRHSLCRCLGRLRGRAGAHSRPAGPDFEGQMRILRAGDGVHFTKFGARKLAHYVERELRRVLSATPVALTTPEPAQPAARPAQPAKPAAPAARPLAGPVFMLDHECRRGRRIARRRRRRAQPRIGDPVANSVLVKGEAMPSAAGRADDLSWPPRVPNLKFDRAAAADRLAGIHGAAGAAAPAGQTARPRSRAARASPASRCCRARSRRSSGGRRHSGAARVNGARRRRPDYGPLARLSSDCSAVKLR